MEGALVVMVKFFQLSCIFENFHFTILGENITWFPGVFSPGQTWELWKSWLPSSSSSWLCWLGGSWHPPLNIHLHIKTGPTRTLGGPGASDTCHRLPLYSRIDFLWELKKKNKTKTRSFLVEYHSRRPSGIFLPSFFYKISKKDSTWCLCVFAVSCCL